MCTYSIPNVSNSVQTHFFQGNGAFLWSSVNGIMSFTPSSCCSLLPRAFLAVYFDILHTKISLFRTNGAFGWMWWKCIMLQEWFEKYLWTKKRIMHSSNSCLLVYIRCILNEWMKLCGFLCEAWFLRRSNHQMEKMTNDSLISRKLL